MFDIDIRKDNEEGIPLFMGNNILKKIIFK